MAASAIHLQDQKLSTLGLTKTTINAEHVTTYSRGLGAVSDQNPVLVLLHGYPQSAYMWRHLIPLLPSNAPLFVPDLPGYGGTPPLEKMDKLSVGNVVLAALVTQVKRSSSGSSLAKIPIVVIGHDRGARVAHRLAVSGYEGVQIKGTSFIDIVPTSIQWRGSAKEIVGYFHWPMLANVSLATRLITAFGGANWAQEMIIRWAGKNPTGLEKLKADDSLNVYGEFFNQPSVIEASNRDYEAGATTDLNAQNEDQENGRKISVKTLLIHSAGIGARFDMKGEWEKWAADGVEVRSHTLGEGIGHFGPEEAPEECAEVINGWLESL